jgi:hypothetical protein
MAHGQATRQREQREMYATLLVAASKSLGRVFKLRTDSRWRPFGKMAQA